MLRGGDLTVAGDDTDIEYIRISLIPQTAQRLDPFDLLRRQSAARELRLDLIDKGSALQHTGIGITQSLQPVLQEVPPLALGTNQQQLFLRPNAV